MGYKGNNSGDVKRNKKALQLVLGVVCIFLLVKVFYKTTGAKKVVTQPITAASVESMVQLSERLSEVEARLANLTAEQVKTTARLALVSKKKKETPLYLSQIKPGDICIFRAAYKEESITGMIERGQVMYANQHGETFQYPNTLGGKNAFLRSSTISVMRAFRSGKFMMQSNKKGKATGKWLGQVCEHKGTEDAVTGEKSLFSNRPCPTTIPWLLTDGLKEYNIKLDENSIWLEFGTRIGDTLKHLYKYRNGNGPIYSFDSFEGLGETVEDTPFRVGKFATYRDVVTLNTGWYADDPQRQGIPENVHILPGWFKDTLPHFLEINKMQKIGLIHMDSSLYSSAKEAFINLARSVQSGCIVIIHEYGYCKETDSYIQDQTPKAFFEFLAETGLGAQLLGSTKFSAAWILLNKDELPGWIKKQRNIIDDATDSPSTSSEITQQSLPEASTAESISRGEPLPEPILDPTPETSAQEESSKQETGEEEQEQQAAIYSADPAKPQELTQEQA